MLAYVFWHRPLDDTAIEAYEQAQIAFHRSLAHAPPAGFQSSAVFGSRPPRRASLARGPRLRGLVLRRGLHGARRAERGRGRPRASNRPRRGGAPLRQRRRRPLRPDRGASSARPRRVRRGVRRRLGRALAGGCSAARSATCSATAWTLSTRACGVVSWSSDRRPSSACSPATERSSACRRAWRRPACRRAGRRACLRAGGALDPLKPRSLHSLDVVATGAEVELTTGKRRRGSTAARLGILRSATFHEGSP